MSKNLGLDEYVCKCHTSNFLNLIFPWKQFVIRTPLNGKHIIFLKGHRGTHNPPTVPINKMVSFSGAFGASCSKRSAIKNSASSISDHNYKQHRSTVEHEWQYRVQQCAKETLAEKIGTVQAERTTAIGIFCICIVLFLRQHNEDIGRRESVTFIGQRI